MNQIVYFFLLLVISLNFKATSSFNWLLLLLVMVGITLIKFKKEGIKLFFILILATTFLQSKIKKWPLENKLSGVVTKVEKNYFILQTSKYKVLIYSFLAPKINQKLIVHGKAEYFQRKNFYDFDYQTYYGIRNTAYSLRNIKIQNSYQKHYFPASNYISNWQNLVFFNKKNKNNAHYYQVFTKLGLAHIIIISSYHFRIFYEWLLTIFNLIFKMVLSQILTLIVLFFITWQLNFKTSASKAFVFILLYVLLGKFRSKIWCLSASGLLFIFINPYLVQDVSFLLTYGFSFLLMFYNSNQKLMKIFTLKMMGFFVEWMWTGRIALFNFVYIFFSFIIFPIYIAIFLQQKWALEIIYALLKFLSNYNYYFVIGVINVVMGLFFLLLLRLIYSLFMKRKDYLINGLLVITFLIMVQRYKINQSFITFINVGQGDSALIKIKNHNYLIDVGKKTNYTRVLKPYFFKEGISQIDFIKISHPHSDHNGALKEWDHEIPIANFNYLGSSFKELNLKKWKSVNNSSSVLLFSHNNTKIMFTGDIDFQVEDYLIKQYPHLKIDILKVAHHGSKYASSLRFLNHFQPQYAIISAGYNNYNHPHPDVIRRLNQICRQVFITKNDGAIKYDFANKTFETSNS